MAADGDEEGAPSGPLMPVEALSTGRSRRATAGNRMRELLEQERERMLAEGEDEGEKREKRRKGEKEEDDGYAMFQQADEEDGGEDVDFEEKGDVEDIVDSDFDMSSDQGDDENDEEAGERALQEEERAAKKAAKASGKAKAIHAAVRRPAAVPRKSALTTDQTDEKRRPKSISFVEGGDEQSARNQRASKRKSTMRVAETVQARLKEDEERRARNMEQAAPKRKKVRLSQADYIAEALEMEERNRESLKAFFEREEARKERDRTGKKTGPQGPFLRWRSVTVNRVSGTQRHAVQVIDSTTGRLTSTQAITLDPVFAARDAAVKARKAREEAMQHDQDERDVEEEGSVAQQGQSTTHSRTTTLSEAQSETFASAHDESVKASAVDGQETAIEKVVQAEKEDAENRAASTVEHRASDAKKDVTFDVDSSMKIEGEHIAEGDVAKEDDVVEKKDAVETNEGKTAVESSAPVKTGTHNNVAAPDHSSTSLHVADASSQTLDAGSEARAYVSLHGLPPSTPWSTWFGHLLGTHVDWASYPVVPARNRPLRPRQSVCPITGLPAKYRDPRSGISFATVEAFESLTKVMRGDFRWSGKEPSSLAEAHRHASSTRYDPLEMGCYFDAMSETGANDVFLLANTSTNDAVGASGSTLHAPRHEYVPRNALAPGDEKAVIAAAHALPAGSTRSGGRRSTAR